MLNIQANQLIQTLPTLRKNYWTSALGKLLPARLLPSMDRGIEVIHTTVLGEWLPPETAKWIHVKDSSDVESLVYETYDDYEPRYFKRPDHWVLILPTPVGNVTMHFEQRVLPAVTPVEAAEDSPATRRPVMITLPHALSAIITPSFSDVDSFMAAFFTEEGGTSNDETVGRVVEQLILANVNELMFWGLAAVSGVSAIIYRLNNG